VIDVPPLASAWWGASVPLVAASAPWPCTMADWVRHAGSLGLLHARHGLAWLEREGAAHYDHDRRLWRVRRARLDALLRRSGAATSSPC
jgi:hypothetical protein